MDSRPSARPPEARPPARSGPNPRPWAGLPPAARPSDAAEGVRTGVFVRRWQEQGRAHGVVVYLSLGKLFAVKAQVPRGGSEWGPVGASTSPDDADLARALVVLVGPDEQYGRVRVGAMGRHPEHDTLDVPGGHVRVVDRNTGRAPAREIAEAYVLELLRDRVRELSPSARARVAAERAAAGQ